MFRRLLHTAAALLLSMVPLQHANAVIGTLDNVPGATLLIPYFEVDLDSATGRNTVVGLHNTSATAMLTRVTLWSNTGVPVYGFNIYFTGYDAISFDMRSVFNGTLPSTASAGQDPTDTISNHGPISQDINFASCTGILPYSTPIAASYLTDMRAMFTGRASTGQFPGQCVGTNAGDNVARGYITVDTVNQCSISNHPNSPGYFGFGVATNQNTMLGDYMLVDTSQNLMSIENAISLEADASNAKTSTPGNYTFYGRLVNWTASDYREPLATRWGLQGETGTSNAIVWRDSKVNQGPFSCGVGRPNWAPLGQEGMSFFNFASQPTVIPPLPTPQNPVPGPPPIVGAVSTQLTPLNNAVLQLPLTTKLGWLVFNLNTTVVAAGANPPIDPAAAQSHVTVLRNQKGVTRLSSGAMALPLDNATAPTHYIEGN